MLNERLVEYVDDVENPLTNFNLAVEYKKIDQTASAILFFLRAADRTDDLNLAYECLIHMGECFDEQKNRSNTVLGLYKHAISILPKRPEAYYKISNYQNWYNQYQDATYFCSIALKICDFNSPPFRQKCKYFGKASLIYENAVSLWWWGKIDECKQSFETLYLEYWDELDTYHRSKIKDFYSQYKFGNIMDVKNLDSQESKNISVSNTIKVVDFFPFFAPTGKELLELRYNILKDYVDEFVICESNRTISGVPIQYELRDILDELKIPREKIKIIDLDIPDDDSLVIKEIDKINCYDGNYENLNSLRARVRERMQKDSLLQVIDEYDDDTIFIHSDSDEIINPQNLKWIIPIIKTCDDSVVKIPLVHLEGRADLRVYLKDSDTPKPWCNSMIICKKHQFKNATPTQIRSNVHNPFPIVRITQDNKIVEDLGWHFSWMGPSKNRILKSKYFTHYDDTFNFVVSGKYGSSETEKFQNELVLKEGSISPSCEVNTVLKNYSHDNLPDLIFTLPAVKNYLLPDEENKKEDSFTFYSQSKPTVWIIDNFYDDPHAVRDFALKQNFIEGGFGKGFIGRRTENQFLFPGMKEAFEKIMGQKITQWESYGENGKFQNAIAGEPLVYHVDAQKWGGVLYLTPNAPHQCGTTLWANKQNKSRNWFDDGWDAVWQPDRYPGDNHLDGSHFEPVDVCGNVFNRLFIFDASSIHSASQYFGGVVENSRLWQMFFFDT